MAAQTCQSCRFFAIADTQRQWEGTWSACRRSAPKPSRGGEIDSATWPQVRNYDWCGEWELHVPASTEGA